MADVSGNVERLRRRFGATIRESHALLGDETVVIAREAAFDLLRFLKEEPSLDFNFLTDITAVDFLRARPFRFEVVYHLNSLRRRCRLRVKALVPEAEPEIDSMTPLWRGADWLEREVWDMFGIRFRGHPNLKRILLYEEFRGFPLRKDYPVNLAQPLVEERSVDGTFVDQRSRNKLLELKKKLAGG
jgi:NADH-quinone oxidoreductase subunit C